MFSNSVKNELAKRIPYDEESMTAELSALVRLAGRIHISSGEIFFEVYTQNPSLARKIFTILKNVLGVRPKVICKKEVRLKKKNVYIVKVPASAGAESILVKLEVLKKRSMTFRVPRELLKNDKCRRSYLCGTFLAAGSVSDPKKGYHLEIVVQSKRFAVSLKELASFMGVGFRIIQRDETWVLYLKNADEIVEFLKLIHADNSVLGFENIRVLKDVRNRVNRIVNCETANLSKTAYAALGQIKEIEYIRDTVGLDVLSDKLREVAELRMENPYSSLKELGQMLNSSGGKSAVNHRMRRIKKIARKLKGEKGSNH